MIERVLINGYRCFRTLDVRPTAGMNIIVGDNESGKSTLLEALGLALTGRANGRWVGEELNPFWFNREEVVQFFDTYGTPNQVAAPTIRIELYFADLDNLQQLRGVHNLQRADCPGVFLHVFPSEDYRDDFRQYLANNPPKVLPIEFYTYEWKDFSDRTLAQRPKELATAFIDARTIRSTSGVDFHTREMLSEHLDARERAIISLAHRRARQEITDEALAPINKRIAEESDTLHDRPIGLQMDQSSRMSWEGGVVPEVDGIPFAMAGQGQQASVKVALAMSRHAERSTFVLEEEPENHLSHTSLSRLIGRIQKLAGTDQQLFITTHNSFVLNRLGLDRLLLLHASRAAKLTDVGSDTVDYFRKLAGYDTLRLVLARKLALVEGPSDVLILERAFRDEIGAVPLDVGVDIMAMGGLTFRRALEVCACLDRQAVALQDNDGELESTIRSEVSHLLQDGKRELLVSDRIYGPTLEPQIVAVNPDGLLRSILKVGSTANLVTWMTNNKTEAALRIFDAADSITYPSYIRDAIELLR